MKQLLLLVTFVFIANLTFTQTNGFTYQAIVRDANGDIITEEDISIKIAILQGSTSGTEVYSESHAITTNGFGLINLIIGDGNVILGNFEDINWGNWPYFIELAIDLSGGTSYTTIGTTQLMGVPYSMYSLETENIGDADSTNELQTLELSSGNLSISNGNTVTLNGFTSPWTVESNRIYYGTGRVGIGKADPSSKLEVKADPTSSTDDPLFQVINKEGDTVFAVYHDGVQVFINDNPSKGNIGGFAVSGRNTSKDIINQYLAVTPDSTRIYVNASPGNIGGFAVSGRNTTKGQTNSFLDLTPDNYFIGHNSGLKTTGLYNSFIGYESGLENTEGSYNSFFGYNSGSQNTTGEANLFLGIISGFSNTSGSSNVFIGPGAGHDNTYASDNVFIGTEAGYGNSDGEGNIFLGNQVGYHNQNGYYNLFIGNRSGFSNTDGEGNVFMGDSAGYSNTNGSENIFIGNKAGYSNTTAHDNVFIGTFTGASNTTGEGNVFLGNNSGLLNSTGNYNVFLGNYCGIDNTTGEANIFLGNGAGFSNSIGSLNVFIGNHAGWDNDTGMYNVFIGNGTGELNQFGSENVFLGNFAGTNNVNGHNNVFIGTDAGYNNDSSDNVFIGSEAGFFNSSGSSNLFLGTYAGYTNQTGNYNVFLGNYAGESNISGEGNVFLGNDAGYENSNGSDNLILGSSAGYSNQNGGGNVFIGSYSGYFETGSEKLYIENSDVDSSLALIYGDFYDNWLRINEYLGIGRNPAANQLEVEGNASKDAPGDWLANSDKRIKTDIIDIKNSYEIILGLRPVKYKYTKKWLQKHPSLEDRYYYNFIAQEFQQIFPESVKGSGEYLEGDAKEILQIDTYNAQIVTIQAVQDLIKENAKQAEEIERLRKKNTSLSNRMDFMEQENKNMRAEIEDIKRVLMPN